MIYIIINAFNGHAVNSYAFNSRQEAYEYMEEHNMNWHCYDIEEYEIFKK